MNRKKFLIIFSLMICLLFSVTVLASAAVKLQGTNPPGQNELKNKKHECTKGGHMLEVYKKKFKLTDEEISKARESGKTIYSLLKEKGISDDQIKATILEEKEKMIDQALKDGKITKEQGDNLKAELKKRMADFPRGFDGKGNFHHGMGLKAHNYMAEILKSKYGVTESEITKARSSGKTIFDLAKEKGLTDEQIRAAMLEAKTKAINQAVKDGKLTKEQGEALMKKIQEKMKDWKPKEKHR